MTEAYYLDNAGRAQSILGYVGNGTVHLTNGIPGKPYRVTILYSADGSGW
jgi:hypothetical protein